MPKATVSSSVSSPSAEADYAALNLELEDVLARLQQPDLPVDEAVTLYEKGLELIHKLETYLETAENKIESLRLEYSQATGDAAPADGSGGTKAAL